MRLKYINLLFLRENVRVFECHDDERTYERVKTSDVLFAAVSVVATSAFKYYNATNIEFACHPVQLLNNNEDTRRRRTAPQSVTTGMVCRLRPENYLQYCTRIHGYARQ